MGIFRLLGEMFGERKWFIVLILIIIAAALYFSGALSHINWFYGGGHGAAYQTELTNGPVKIEPSLCNTMAAKTNAGTIVNVATYADSEGTHACSDASNTTTEDMSFVTPYMQVLCMENTAGLGTKPITLWVRNQQYNCADLQH